MQPEITRAEQLKGQTLGITRFNSTAHTVSALILRKLGLTQSVTLRPLGGNPEVQAAFEQKQIAGMVTSVRPRSPANSLMNAADLEVPYAMNVIAMTREFLQKNYQTAERVLRAYIEGVAAMNHDRETALKILAKYLKRNDPAFLDEMYKIAVQFTDHNPRIDPRTVVTVLEFEPVKGADAESLTPKAIDNRCASKSPSSKAYTTRIHDEGIESEWRVMEYWISESPLHQHSIALIYERSIRFGVSR